MNPRKLTASRQYGKYIYLLDNDNNIVASLDDYEDAKWIAKAANSALTPDKHNWKCPERWSFDLCVCTKGK